jgi:hypothetical protein
VCETCTSERAVFSKLCCALLTLLCVSCSSRKCSENQSMLSLQTRSAAEATKSAAACSSLWRYSKTDAAVHIALQAFAHSLITMVQLASFLQAHSCLFEVQPTLMITMVCVCRMKPLPGAPSATLLRYLTIKLMTHILYYDVYHPYFTAGPSLRTSAERTTCRARRIR